MTAPYHPQIVHFAVALLVVGVAFRVLSLWWRRSFLGPAAAVLLLLGTGAAAAAVRSGLDAHGPVERMPGARAAVVEHEDWGIRTRNVFFGVILLEAVALALRRSNRQVYAHAAAAALGLAGVWCLYQAGDKGGALVYSYAGGVGIRSGEARDVERLLLAGLYHQSQLDRKAGRHEAAALLVAEAAQRFPGDLEVQVLAAESALVDRKDPVAALAILERHPAPSDLRFLLIRHGLLRTDALEATGRHEEAMAAARALVEAFPTNTRVKARLEALTSPGR
jgi:uncharacterized membrane protein